MADERNVERSPAFVNGRFVKQGSVRNAPVSSQPQAETAAQHAQVSDDMTKDELIAVADRRGVDVPSGSTKAEIIAILNG